MRLVVGLGNPGARYAETRHNVAWRVLDRLAARWKATPGRGGESYAVEEARVRGEAIELMRPLTYMNESGVALEAWRLDRGGPPESLLVVADDIWLPVGSLRLRARGGSGGHRGFESVEAGLGTREYARLRIGVGEAETMERLKDHVLGPFTEEEQPRVADAVERAADAVECWMFEGVDAAMGRFNQKVTKEVEEP